MDRVSPARRSKIMSKIRSSNTGLEVSVFAVLKEKKIAFEQNKLLFGKPDVVLSKKKTALFIDSCFWHGCRWHCRMPHTRKTYWNSKILRNRKRDKLVTKELKRQGWKVIRLWEHAIHEDIGDKIDKLNLV